MSLWIANLVSGRSKPQGYTDPGWLAERAAHVNLLRDIFGNPFASAAAVPEGVFAWDGGTIPTLAEAAYQERDLPGGELDPDRLAVLADALKEVGADALLIEHLRGPGPHVRGCWVIDALTGRG